MGTFAQFHPRLQQQIVSRLGWKSLRPVQEESGAVILEGKNCVVLAPTAGGKTESAFFPILSRILETPKRGVRAVYISPLKALLNNLEERIGLYADMVGLSSFKWHGDVSPTQKKAFLNEPSEILLTTPESLEAMLVSLKFPSERVFGNLDFVVVDEIHALAAVDRGSQLLCLFERIKWKVRSDFQRIGLSATVGNPDEILNWLQGSSEREKELIVPPKNPSRKNLYVYYNPEPHELLWEINRRVVDGKSLLFCNSRSKAEEIGTELSSRGVLSFVHHSSLSLGERERAESIFTKGERACIVSTSTMELGIDIGDLDRVLQIESPGSVASFLQRMGRTGRREGTISNMAFFVEDEENFLEILSIIENARAGWVERVRFSGRMWHLLLQQVMAITLEYGGILRKSMEEILSRCPPFSQISGTELNEFLDYLIEKEYLFSSDYLSMGVKAEEEFGRRNFMKLLSVFQTPQEFQVVTRGERVIGSIQRDFVDRLIPNATGFMLGGKAWLVLEIDWNSRRILVEMAPEGMKTQWSGSMPFLLQKEVGRKMREILLSTETYSYLEEGSLEVLSRLREEYSPVLRRGEPSLFREGDDLTLLTFAGGYVNFTLKIALIHEIGCDVYSSNTRLKIKSIGDRSSKVKEVLGKMKDVSYWSEPVLQKELTKYFPNYRISKFQGYLPEKYQLEILGIFLLDIEGTIKYLNEVDFSNTIQIGEQKLLREV